MMTTLDSLVNVIERQNFVVLDTETTGLKQGEICQIAFCNHLGNILVDTLVRTQQPIPREAIAIHGITNDAIKTAPTYLDLLPHLKKWLAGKDVIIYNASYDMRLMRQTEERWGVRQIDSLFTNFHGHCAMEAYAEFNGDWNDYHQNYRWVKLEAAYRALHQKTDEMPYKPHTATGDVMMTYDVCQSLYRIKTLR